MGWGLDFLPPAAGGIYWTGNPTNPVGLAWERDVLPHKADAAYELLVVVDYARSPGFRNRLSIRSSRGPVA
jgi:hypothetical protein